MNDPALAMRLLRARRKEAGVCIYCGGPLLTTTMCEPCADKKRPGTGETAMRAKRRYPLVRKSASKTPKGKKKNETDG
ncbi:hypothetical protein D7Z26_09375 [Cohnella endophytica]|uniref:Uncharacterized protein n=1 Tax=Cohnella endophytica TaxID=2419778 RepID=A0A494XY18_9BACL|nr:hypothetical protein D7Z26_09375 [Cohnella endophytica]